MRRVLLVLCAATLLAVYGTLSWAEPGDELWRYPTTGGYSTQTYLAIDNSGDRIMATTVTSGSFYYWSIVKVDKDGNYKWNRTFSGSHSKAQVRGIAADTLGNVIVIGTEWNGNDWDWKVISYSPSGYPNWSDTYDSGKDDGTVAVAVDHNGNVAVTGYEYVSGKGYNWRTVSYSTTGGRRWVMTHDSGEADKPRAIAIDSNGNVIVGGYDHDGTTKNWRVISYSPVGNIKWSKGYDSGKDDGVNAIAVDSSNNVLVAGYEYESNYNWRVVSYNSNGDRNWIVTYDGGKHDSTRAIAVDSSGNVIVAGYKENSSSNYDWLVIAYSASGNEKWSDTYDSGKDDGTQSVAIDSYNNAIVTGYTYEGNYNWRTVSYSSSGDRNWVATYDSGDHDKPYRVLVDRETGTVSVAGYILHNNNAMTITYEGNAPSGHLLLPGEVTTIDPAPQTPNPENGKYLGFGDLSTSKENFKIEAAFPPYLGSDGSVLSVKIFIAAQMPDDYSRLAYFDSSNNLRYQPPERLSSWKSSVSGALANTVVLEAWNSATMGVLPSGTHYWYTLVVPDTVPDDFSGVDWATTPWEITVNIVEVE